MTKLVAEEEVKPIELVTPDGGAKIVSPTISATAVRLQLGAKWGLTVAFLDIAKAFVPTLVFYLLYPDQPYYLVCAMMTPIGHNWPVFHGFKGGAGQSCILGGMLVIDWVAVIVTSVASQVIGLWVIRDGVVADAGGIFLLIPWLWWRTGFDPWVMTYAFVVNIAFYDGLLAQLQAVPRREAIRPPAYPRGRDGHVRLRLPFMRKLSPKRYAEVDARAAAAKARASLQSEPGE